MKKGDKDKQQGKGSDGIINAQQYFRILKQYMKTTPSKSVGLSELVNTRKMSEGGDLGRLISYTVTRRNVTKDTPISQIQSILNQLLRQAHLGPESFVISDQKIFYKYKITFANKSQFLVILQKHYSQGILVNDDFLKFSSPDVTSIIAKSIKNRDIIAVRSKNYEKAKAKDDNYQGYILIPFSNQIIKQTDRQFLYKISSTQLSKELDQEKDREPKMKKIYKTRTSEYRRIYQSICSENANKSQQDRSGQGNSIQAFRKNYLNWDIVNRDSIPNFQKEAQQWFKNRKV